MIKRNTWVLLGIFVILIGAAWYLQKNKGQNASQTPEPTSSSLALWNIDEATIASVRIQSVQGQTLGIGRDQSGKWAITEPKPGPADASQVESGITQLVALRTTTSLNPTTDLAVYGLTKASYTITVNINGGKQYVLIIGDVTPTGSGYYIRLDQNPPQVVSKYSIDALLGMLKNPPYPPTATPAATNTIPISGTLPAATTQP